MSLGSKHPEYMDKENDLLLMDDVYNGATRIKSKGAKYLYPTKSMILDGFTGAVVAPTSCNAKKGDLDYSAYLSRSIFYEYVREGVHNYLGLLCQKPPIIDNLPEAMKYMLQKISNYDESLPAFLRRIYENQLIFGRCGILADLPSLASTESKPYLSLYSGLSIINWNDTLNLDKDERTLNLVVLDESGPVFQSDFSWLEETSYRVLITGDDETIGVGTYKQGLFDGDEATFNYDELTEVLYKGKSLEKIPFVFANASDTTTKLRTPPLKGLADLSLSIYRSEADYRETLHKQGQDTLVVKGMKEERDPYTGAILPTRVGAGASIITDLDGDAKFIGVGYEGLSEQRLALENDKANADTKAGQFVGTKQSSQESGDAMRTRIASRTTTLHDIADAGAAALQEILQIVAVWMGVDREKAKNITITPNKDFANTSVNSQDLVQIITSRNIGAPLSLESLHQWCKDQGLTTMTFQDEMDIISKEIPGTVKPLTVQIDKSTGQQVGVKQVNQNTVVPPDNTNTPVDSRP